MAEGQVDDRRAPTEGRLPAHEPSRVKGGPKESIQEGADGARLSRLREGLAHLTADLGLADEPRFEARDDAEEVVRHCVAAVDLDVRGENGGRDVQPGREWREEQRRVAGFAGEVQLESLASVEDQPLGSRICQDSQQSLAGGGSRGDVAQPRGGAARQGQPEDLRSQALHSPSWTSILNCVSSPRST